MNFIKKWVFIIVLSVPYAGFAQDTLINKLDSLSRKKDSAGQQINNINPNAYNQRTDLDFKSYFVLLGSSLKQEFTKPFHMSGKDWRNFGIFTGATAGLFLANKPIQKAALKFRNRNTGFNDISKNVTKFGGLYEGYTLLGLTAYGLVFKDKKIVTTTLLATQSYITAGALQVVLKYLAGETRPSYYGPDQIASPRFLGPFSKVQKNANGKKTYSSFPSGHTTVAFAAATVFASEYRDKPIIPIVAYSAASLIGISRITENMHWFTDVVVGAALGFLSGKQVVNNYHRYAKLKAPDQAKNSISFTINYSYGHIEPGLVYKFR
ncbi:MAG: phosphatase PAP2 family protein [Ginsengibacter sp.]